MHDVLGASATKLWLVKIQRRGALSLLLPLALSVWRVCVIMASCCTKGADTPLLLLCCVIFSNSALDD
jgi:hypothetical protein